jgi:hypothetical protein
MSRLGQEQLGDIGRSGFDHAMLPRGQGQDRGRRVGTGEEHIRPAQCIDGTDCQQTWIAGT